MPGTGARTVIGIDPTRAQIVEAAVRGGGPSYARAGADALPFASESFDAVVACLVVEHTESFSLQNTQHFRALFQETEEKRKSLRGKRARRAGYSQWPNLDAGIFEPSG